MGNLAPAQIQFEQKYYREAPDARQPYAEKHTLVIPFLSADESTPLS